MAGRHCWNDEAMAAMVTYMATPWQTFYQNLQAFHDDNSGLIENTFDGAIALCMSSSPLYRQGSAADHIQLILLASQLTHKGL